MEVVAYQDPNQVTRRYADHFGNGYQSAAYLEAFRQWGAPLFLRQSSTQMLLRQVPGTPYQDLTGAYPIFSCHDWSLLSQDLAGLDSDIVCCSLVTDPFDDVSKVQLESCFPHIVRYFKDHYIVDLTHDLNHTVSAHHRYYARKSLKKVSVQAVEDSAEILPDWVNLYQHLKDRHRIGGMSAFSDESFRAQMDVPGVRIYQACLDEVIVGMHIWYINGSRAYHHLSAFSPEAYRERISYGLMWGALAALKEQGIEQANLGGGAGIESGAKNGLVLFKKGWCSYELPSFFCGRIFNNERYMAILDKKNLKEDGFFPAYRKEDFS